jgi:hypothetical protein
MDTPYQAPLTPEQLAAVEAGGGYAQCQDPKSHVIYHLIQQPEPSAIDDDYVREKIEEAYADIARNGFRPLDMSAIKAELHRRIRAKTDVAH